MSSRDPAPARAPDEILFQLVESLFSGPGYAPVASVNRRPSDASTSYRSEVITIRLADGACHRLFLKDFGSTRLPKGEPAARRSRELLVYERLLVGAEVGTPAYLGHLWDEREGRFWLLLELVEGSPLRHEPFECWLAAAAWLGWMQGRLRGRRRELESCTVLERHDQSFFASTVAAALSAVSEYRSDLGEHLNAVLDGYGRLCRLMAAQAATLVHGSYRPANVLISRASAGLRVCPIDWELAAFGSPLYDLAFIVDGFEPPRLDLLLAAYRLQAEAGGVRLPKESELRLTIQSLRLHKVLKSLSGCLERGFAEPTVRKLVGMVESSKRAIDAGDGQRRAPRRRRPTS